jgi:WD40 repeat protein
MKRIIAFVCVCMLSLIIQSNTVAIIVPVLHVHAQSDAEIVLARWNNSGELLAIVTQAGSLSVINPENHQTVWEHQLGDFQPRVSWSPQVSTHLAVSAYEYGAEVWDVQTGERVLELPTAGWVRDIAYDFTGNRIATAHGLSVPLGGGKIQFWDALTGQLIRETFRDGRFLTSLSWSPGGERIGAIDGDTFQAVIYDTATAQLIRAVPPLETDEELVSPLLEIRWSPVGDSFLTFGGGVGISVWNSETYEISAEWSFSGGINDFAFDSTGRRVAIATDVGVLVVNLSGNILVEIPTTGRANTVSWMPDSTLLTFAGEIALETIDVSSLINTPTDTPAATHTPAP